MKLRKFLKSINNSQVNKPWGWYKTILEGQGWWLKKLHVNGGRLSLQEHSERGEVWVIKHKGKLVTDFGSKDDKEQEEQFTCFEHNKKVFTMYFKGDFFIYPISLADYAITTVVFGPNTLHRIGGNVDFYEFAFGNPVESDIKRIEDDFGRIAK